MRGPVTAIPPRRPGSLRRTTHLDIAPSTNPAARFVRGITGSGRDLLTDANGAPHLVATGSVRIEIGDDGTISDALVDPTLPSSGALIGGRLGPGFRMRIEAALIEAATTPMSVLLGDLTGAPAGMRYGLVRRGVDTRSQAFPGDSAVAMTPTSCSGWRSGSAAVEARAIGISPPMVEAPDAAPLASDGDEFAWHPMGELALEHGRRARRIDLWRDHRGIHVDAFFRDVNREPGGREVVVHEYGLRALIDAETGRLLAIFAEPHVLPLEDCPFAAAHVGDLVGTTVRELAIDIHRRHRGEGSCTHLNDMVRFLGDVPELAARLNAMDTTRA